MILLPRHSDRGNNVASLAMNKKYGKQFTCRGITIVARTPEATKFERGKKILLLHYCSLHLSPPATKTSMTSAHIATLVNVATTSYCHGWQRTTMVATKDNYCNTRLAMVASSYCNKIFCNHGQ